MTLFQPNLTHAHVPNKFTHVDHFWCLISKYIEYDNIFINWSLKFCNKKFQTNAYQVKFFKTARETGSEAN